MDTTALLYLAYHELRSLRRAIANSRIGSVGSSDRGPTIQSYTHALDRHSSWMTGTKVALETAAFWRRTVYDNALNVAAVTSPVTE